MFTYREMYEYVHVGSRNAECYLASPEVVAASAIKGHIAAPYSEQPLSAPLAPKVTFSF